MLAGLSALDNPTSLFRSFFFFFSPCKQITLPEKRGGDRRSVEEEKEDGDDREALGSLNTKPRDEKENSKGEKRRRKLLEGERTKQRREEKPEEQKLHHVYQGESSCTSHHSSVCTLQHVSLYDTKDQFQMRRDLGRQVQRDKRTDGEKNEESLATKESDSERPLSYQKRPAGAA